jgi:O-antigen/teichoic acid export membrane protein
MNILMTANTLNNTKSEISDASAVAYGIKSSIYLAINTIANHLDKLLLFYFLSADIVALYIVAERLSDLAKSVVQDFTAVLAPRFARLAQYTKQVDRLLKLIGLFFSVGILLLAFTVLPWAVVLIFSERYIEAIPVAQGLMVSVAIGIHATLRARYVTSKLDGVSVRDIYVTISIARIIFTCLLVPLFGLWGAVASAIMYRIASSVLVHFVIIKRYLPNE